MSTSAEDQKTENGRSHVNEESTAIESECEIFQCSITENEPSEVVQTESPSDWLVMVCAFSCLVLSGINIFSYAVLYLPLTEMFQSSRAAIGWILSFYLALTSFLGIFFSHLVNMFGCRRPAVVGGLLIAIGNILSCFSPSLEWMYLLKGIVPGIGGSLMVLSCHVIIQQRFNKHRSLAAGIAMLGMNVGGMIGPPLIQYLLDHYGLRGTLALIGAIHCHYSPLALQFRSPKHFKRANNQTELTDSDKRTTCDKLKGYIRGSLDFTLLRKTTFLLFCLSGLLHTFTVNSYVPHVVNSAMAAGVPRYLAVWAVSTLGFSSLASRLFVSLIADSKYVNRFIVFACGLFFAFLACISPLLLPDVFGSFCSVILYGFHAGCTLTIVSVLLVDLQGVKNIARSFALYRVFTSFSFLTGSSFMGLTYDLTGSYTVGFVTLSCVALVALSFVCAIYIIQRKQVVRMSADTK